MVLRGGKMKKAVCLLIAVMILICGLVGCGVNTEEVKSALTGTWGYYYNASAVEQDCYQLYQFSSDDTVVSAWVNEDAPSKSSKHMGTYKINNSTIVIDYSDGKKSDTIEYTFNEGTLKLTDKGSDGSTNNELIKQ